MSGNMHLYMYVSDTVQEISIYWIVSSKLKFNASWYSKINLHVHVAK